MTILNSIKYQYQLNYYLFILQNTGLALHVNSNECSWVTNFSVTLYNMSLFTLQVTFFFLILLPAGNLPAGTSVICFKIVSVC